MHTRVVPDPHVTGATECMSEQSTKHYLLKSGTQLAQSLIIIIIIIRIRKNAGVPCPDG